MKNSVHVNCVYGPDHIDHISNVLIPSFVEATKRRVVFNCLCYKGDDGYSIKAKRKSSISINNVVNASGRDIGFAEAHNTLFKAAEPSDFFILINPDCVAQPSSVDALINRFESADGIGIVEGRQWPFEHPKEFDQQSFDTPWASAAFALVNAEAYRKVGGMDECYFLYLEDVDLSWRIAMEGYRVIYEPSAPVMHFSGGRFYRPDLVENEKYYSIRNFIVFMWKFFGNEGKSRALQMLADYADREIVTVATADVDRNFSFPSSSSYPTREFPSIKVTGICQFHEMRQ